MDVISFMLNITINFSTFHRYKTSILDLLIRNSYVEEFRYKTSILDLLIRNSYVEEFTCKHLVLANSIFKALMMKSSYPHTMHPI